MTIATALLITTLGLGLGTGQGPLSATDRSMDGAPASQQASSGVVFSPDVQGRISIYTSDRRLVVRLDKPAGRPLQVALEPGGYEVRLGADGARRLRFQVAEGQQFTIELGAFEAPEEVRHPVAGHPPAGVTEVPMHHAARPFDPYRRIDPRHRIEIRFGGWADGWYDYDRRGAWHTSGSAQGAFGLEYLNFVRNDLAFGLAVNGRVRANGCWDCWNDTGAAQVVTSIPVVARWYPVRRLTRSRAVEPYMSGGVGPVFGVDTVYTGHVWSHDWHHDGIESTRVATRFGGRVGGGVDVRLGHTFTLGVAGAWNWDTGFPDELWRGAKPNGGECTVVLGWMWGR